MRMLARNTLTAVFGASIVALSLTAASPAHAGAVGGLTAKFMMNDSSKLHTNTRQEAKKQIAADPSSSSHSSNAEVWIYDFEPTGNSIARRRWMPN